MNYLRSRRHLPEAVQKIRVTQLSPSSVNISPKLRHYPSLSMASSKEASKDAILFLGVAGWGKSSIIAKATGEDVPIGHGCEYCTLARSGVKIDSADQEIARHEDFHRLELHRRK